MSFEKQFSEYADTVNRELERAMDIFTPKELAVSEAMRYSLLAGGKRVRPVLSLAVCDALCGDCDCALRFGCALEMIHTYSLIHDDLPCMDNDTLRRGRPTCHVQYGEAYALLAGDGLLTLAFEYIAKTVKDERALSFISVLSECAGISGMVGGQADDIKAEGESVSMEFLRFVHARKTGALINAAGAAGAIAAGRGKSFAEEYTAALGLAFQIKDDILDVTGDQNKMGKTLMKDAAGEKTTFVTLMGLEGAKRELEKETEKAIKACGKFGEKGEFLREFALWLLAREI